MGTVLPTPAPPNMATLPPLTKGAIKSTTLIRFRDFRSRAYSWESGGTAVNRGMLGAGNRPFAINQISQRHKRCCLTFSFLRCRMGDPVAVTGSPRFSRSRGPRATVRTLCSPAEGNFKTSKLPFSTKLGSVNAS